MQFLFYLLILGSLAYSIYCIISANKQKRRGEKVSEIHTEIQSIQKTVTAMASRARDRQLRFIEKRDYYQNIGDECEEQIYCTMVNNELFLLNEDLKPYNERLKLLLKDFNA